MKLPFFSSSTTNHHNNPSNNHNNNPNSKKKKNPRTPITTLLPNQHSTLQCSPSSSSSSSSICNPNPNTFTRSQLDLVLRRLGGGEDEVEAMLGAVDLDNLSVLKHLPGAEGGEEEMKAVFGFFDGDGDGRISAEELREALAALGDDGCSVDECRRMIAGVDSSGGGFVCFGDFARMMLDAQRSM